MSTISTTNFEAGETTNRTDTNNKFSAVQTATGSINEGNTRSEGIDKRQLAAHSYSTGRMEPVVWVDYTTNCTSSITSGVYSNQDGTDAFYISHGDGLHLNWTGPGVGPDGGVVVKAGDLVRIHFDIFLSQINDPGYASNGPAGPTGAGRVNNRPDGIGILFFPLWKINGGSFTQLANEADLDASLTAPASISFNNTANTKVDSVAFCSMEGYLQTNCFPARTVHGTWNYIHTGADITINEIKLYCRGPMVYQWTGGSRVFHAPVWGTGRYANGYLDIPAAGGTNFNISLSNGHLGAVIMRGDS
jgi:hypothetical protein